MITMEIFDAMKRDWLFASRAMQKVADQIERDFGVACKIKCPAEMGLQDFWGTRQWKPEDGEATESIRVSVQDAKLADLKHHLAYGFHRVFRKTQELDNPLPAWYFARNIDYLMAKGRQQLQTRFQWKETYVAFIPPLQRPRGMSEQWPSVAFYKRFLEKTILQNNLPIQVLDIQGASFVGSWEKPLVAPSEFGGCLVRYCMDLYAFADWLLNASCVIAEESWMTDFAACLRVPSFVLYEKHPSNIFYHFGYSDFFLRYYAYDLSKNLLDHHHVYEEFSTFCSELLCVPRSGY